MEEEGEISSPFWSQSNTSSSRRRSSRSSSSSSSSVFLNSGVLVVILPIIAIVFIFIIIPSFLSFTSQFVKPNLVKKSWDYLNFLLVLFAILCGIFGRKTDQNDEGNDQYHTASSSSSTSNLVPNVVRSSSSSSSSLVEESPRSRLIKQQWSEHPYQYRVIDNDSSVIDESSSTTNNLWSSSSNHQYHFNSGGTGLMRRNSNSYPDLRQESLWVPSVDRRRFYDDFDVHNYRYEESSSSTQDHVQRCHFPQTPPFSEADHQDSVIKTIPVDTFQVIHHDVDSSPPPPPPQSESPPPPPSEPPSPPTPSPPPPPPPPPRYRQQTEQKQRRTFQTIAKSSEAHKHSEYKKFRLPPPSPPPPAPPPPPPPQSRPRSNRSETKGKGKDIKSTLASLYNQRKRKKKQRSKENFDDIFRSDADTYTPQFGPPPSPPAPPPPPPPPPPTSVFHQLFKKSNKNKKIHSITSSKPPPPPPPPPPRTPPHPVDSPRRRKSVAAGRPPLPTPPLPTRMNSSYYPMEDNYLNSGNQSPLIPMPPPPPPPPFRMPELKFVVRGDFVKIHSSRSSRSTSPDLDYVDSPTNQDSPMMNGGDSGTSTPFCPSPDVHVLNDKANSFIARFRAGLKLEKMNSIKQKQEVGTSSSPDPGTSPGPN